MNNIRPLHPEHEAGHSASTLAPSFNAIPTSVVAAAVPKVDPTIAYHLDELSILSDPFNSHNDYPVVDDRHNVILDVGCGIGQAFVSTGLNRNPDKTLYGIDIDLVPLQYGKENHQGIRFINGSAEDIPLQSEHVDFVISRVSLPYTNVPKSVAEIYRVLKPGGEIWITLHPFSFFSDLIQDCWQNFSTKKLLDNVYTLGNGLVFHVTGRLISKPLIGGMESLQTKSAMNKLMQTVGFENIEMKTSKSHFLITATKPER